ncbi:DUF262 domain-containing protein [Planomonospora parontospora]|uniref:DUF262 domain-containing protein n=1 Tax=Planomonospora parontospora TaxID=58119 RepID=UPI00166F84A4|nr:DUF262 domain-containing protein [Planomonospora parontospora]GGL53030.1 hypothetical protein GCM10014719_62880 [Planomonospora parontospora subsp. antibiotica]GII18704.1 hypothetical protein Ppa05_54300 [Planomonospora parontospora subsp. antibiotica]
MTTFTRPRVEQTRPAQLVEWALSGRIHIPSFHRPYRWGRENVLSLFQSVLQGYPIGSLIVWQRPVDAATLWAGPLAITAEARPDALWVIDGQQRVISLVGVLAAPPDTFDPRFRIFFDLGGNSFAAAEQDQQIPDRWFPMSAVLSTAATLAWRRERPWLTNAELARCDAMVTAVRDFPIAMYVFEGDGPALPRYVDIFQRINTSGTALRHDEIEAAQRISARTVPPGLDTLASAVRSTGFGTLPEHLLSRSVRVAHHGDGGRGLLTDPGRKQERDEALRTTARALGAAAEFLRDEAGIPHVRLLPYSLVLPALTRFVVLFGPPRGRAAELLRRWIWRGAVLGMAHRGHTAALREYSQVIEGDPVSSADRLLALLPPYTTWEPDLNAVRLDRAQAKVNLLGLLSLRPQALVQTGESGDQAGATIDPNGLMEARRPPWIRITSLHGEIPSGLLADLLIHPRSASHADIRRVLLHEEVDSGILESHLIDTEGLDLLRTGREHEFVAHRAGLVRAAIAEHVQENALFGFPDGPDPTGLITPGDAG